jgi:hypothetical protein
MNMKSSKSHPNSPAAAVRKAAAVIAFAAVLGALPLRAAFADDDHRRDDREHQNRGHHHEEAGRRHYRYPVYAPPPIYRPRYESPGIRLVFPIEIR